MKVQSFIRRIAMAFSLFLFAAVAVAESSITFTTNRKVGEKLTLVIGASGGVRFDGASGTFKNYREVLFTIEKQTITITGEIESFSCAGCEITALDVTKAPELTFLSCENNEIQTLDLKENLLLRSLYCQTNKLSELNIAKQKDLGLLSCAENQLSALDVTNNADLMELYCYGNQLSELKVDHLQDLRKLSCSDNQLTALDVTKNADLRSLFCFGNRLTALNVSNNTALYQLSFSNNQITAIDLSKNKDLEILFAEKNPLAQSLDVSHLTNLEQLYVSHTHCKSLDLRNNAKLTELSCSHNQLRGLDLSGKSQLRQVWIQDNLMNTDSMHVLIERLPTRIPAMYGRLVMKDAEVADSNVCFREDVERASKKYWTLLELHGDYTSTYEGVIDGLNQAFAQKLICRYENGLLTLQDAKPNVAYTVYDLRGRILAQGRTDARGRVSRMLAASAHQRLIIKVAQCGTLKI